VIAAMFLVAWRLFADARRLARDDNVR